MAVEVGTAYVTLMPSMSKFTKQVRDGLKNINLESTMSSATESAAEAAGKTAKKAMSKAGSDSGKAFWTALTNAAKNQNTSRFHAQVREAIKKGFDFSDVADEAGKKAERAFAKAGRESGKAFWNSLIEAAQSQNNSRFDDAFHAQVHETIKSGFNFSDLADESAGDTTNAGAAFGKNFTTGFMQSIVGGGGLSDALSGGLSGAMQSLDGKGAGIFKFSATGFGIVKKWFDKTKEYAFAVMDQISQKLTDVGTRAAEALFTAISDAYSRVGTLLRDITSKVLESVTSLAQEAYGRVGSLMTELTSRVLEGVTSAVSEAYQRVGSLMTEMGGISIKTAAENLGIDFGFGFEDGLSTVQYAIGNMLGNIATNALSTVTNNISGAIERLDTIQNFPRIMANMGIDAEVSARSINALSDSIDGLPTALDDIVMFTQKIFPTFNGDLDEATKSAIAFNNAVVASGSSTARQSAAMEQWSQMMANNKVDMLSWRTVVEAMPAQMNQLAEAFGASSPTELYNMMNGSQAAKDAGGGKPFKELNDMLVKLNDEGLGNYASFAEQAEVATYGIGTAITNLTNRIQKSLELIGNWIGQSTIAGAINNFTSKFVPKANEFVDILDRIGARDVFNGLGDKLSQTIDQLSEKLAPIKERLEPFLSGALNGALGVVSDTLDHIIERAEPFFQLVGEKMQNFIDDIDGVKGKLQPIIDAFVDWKFDTWTAAFEMWEKIIDAVAPVLPSIFESISRITQTLATFVGNISYDVAGVANNLFSTIATTLETIRPNIENIISSAAPLVESMASTIASIVVYVSQLASDNMPMVERIITAVGDTINDIIDNVGPELPTIIEGITRITEVAAKFVGSISSGVADTLGNLLTTIADTLETIQPLVENILVAAGPIVEGMATTIADVVKYVVQLAENNMPTVQRLMETIGSVISQIMENVGPWLPHIIESSARIAETAATFIGNISGEAGSVLSNLLHTISETLEVIRPFVEQIITSLAPVIETMAATIAHIINIAVPAINEALKLTDENGVPLLQHAVQTIGDAMQRIMEALAPYLGTILEAITEIIDALAPAIAEIVEAIAPLIPDIAELFVYAAQTIAPALVEIFRDYIAPYMPEIKTAIKDIIDFAATHIKSLARQIIIILHRWEPFWTNFQRLADVWVPAILNVFGFIAELVGGILDVIASISEALDKLPKIDIDHWGDWFTNNTSVPSVSPLASGGIATAPTNALIAEAGTPEAVVPLSAEGIQRFTSGLDPKYKNGGGDVNISIDTIVNNDTRTDARDVAKEIGTLTLRDLQMRGVA